jgi:hypothetical protein
VLGVQILKLLGRVVIGVKTMSEDIAVLNGKIDKIEETFPKHYKPTMYVGKDNPTSTKYGVTLL